MQNYLAPPANAASVGGAAHHHHGHSRSLNTNHIKNASINSSSNSKTVANQSHTTHKVATHQMSSGVSKPTPAYNTGGVQFGSNFVAGGSATTGNKTIVPL